MWTIAAVNKKIDGPLGSYNGLTDVHLAHYFSRPSRQSHLKAAKLITNDGTIIPEQKVKVASLEYERQKHIYNMLANTVIQNAAHKQGSWNKKVHNYLEDVSRMENVEVIKVGSKKNTDFPLQNRSTKSTMTHPFHHLNFCGWFKEKYKEYVANLPRSAPSTSKSHVSYSSGIHQNMSHLKRCFSAKESSPYTIPLLLSGQNPNHSTFFTHKSNRLKKKKRQKKRSNSVQPNSLSKEETSNKLTMVSLPDRTFKIDSCKITLRYHGHLPFNYTQKYHREEILIRQQHCGGTPVVVYKGQVAPNETITFICLNHDGYTFSITLFLDGIRYLKLSSCCVFRYHLNRRLGGFSGNFSIQNIEGGKPCLRCQCNKMEVANECSKDLKQKLICAEKYEPRAEMKDVISLEADESVKEAVGSFMNESKNSIDTEDVESLIESENNSENEMDNQSSMTDNEIIEDDIAYQEPTIQLEEEDVKSETVSSYDSDTSINSVAESVKPLVKPEFQIKPYENASSSDDEDGKQHVILASVHGSPSVSE